MNRISHSAQIALVFFASSKERKIEYVNGVRWPKLFLLNENGDTTTIPLVAITCRFAELIQYDIAGQFEVITRCDHSLYHELSALVELILASRSDYDYMWHLDKEAAGVSGFADHLWCVVARLATKVLDALEIDPSQARIDIESLVPTVRPEHIIPIRIKGPVAKRDKPRT